MLICPSLVWRADDLFAANRIMGGSDTFALVGLWKRNDLHNLNKREAPSQKLAKTSIMYSTTVINPPQIFPC